MPRTCEEAAPGTGTASDDRTPSKVAEPLSLPKVPGVPDMRAVAELLAAMPDPAAEVELRRQLCRETYQAGLAEGWRLGVEHGARVRAAEWPAIVAPLSQPEHAELELLRYGPEGREHFGDRRPGDYTPPTRLEAAS